MEKFGNFYLFGCFQNILQNFLLEYIVFIEYVLDFLVCLMKIILFLVFDDERMLKRVGEVIDNFKDMVFLSGYELGVKKRVIFEFLDQFGE